MKNCNFACEYLNKKLTKANFCKSKSISRNSLNIRLNSDGIKIACKTETNGNNLEQKRTNRNNWVQKRKKIKNSIMFTQVHKTFMIESYFRNG
ncbi:hypothetical protein BDFB_014675 [Asbolus verrucosus]|uniref:Uncharacterized protein n=1 Tax=Asbolus verrucosus TaxID=1661398 RepID=A0A482VTV6_ASBVE|nr:hypothetical protein BDFB_014675 [Asbolus verrucosus]